MHIKSYHDVSIPLHIITCPHEDPMAMLSTRSRISSRESSFKQVRQSSWWDSYDQNMDAVQTWCWSFKTTSSNVHDGCVYWWSFLNFTTKISFQLRIVQAKHLLSQLTLLNPSTTCPRDVWPQALSIRRRPPPECLDNIWVDRSVAPSDGFFFYHGVSTEFWYVLLKICTLQVESTWNDRSWKALLNW